MWEFASVVAFLDSFEGDLKLHSFNLSGLEGALVELERVAEEHRTQASALSAAAAAAAADQEEKSRSTTNGGDTPPSSSPSSSSVAEADKVVKKKEKEQEEKEEEKEEAKEEEVEGKQNGDHSEANGGHEEEEEGEGAKEERKRKRQVKKEKEDDDESEEAGEKAKEEEEEGGDDDDDDDKERDDDDDERNAKRRRRKKAKATEPWMENAGYQHLANLHIALLKNIVGRGASLLTMERWEGYLQRELDKHWDEAMEAYFGPDNPLENSNYLALSLRTKVLLLKVVCDLQLDANAALLAEIHEIGSKGDHAQLRPTALGRDGRSRLYWYFSSGRHPYLYRETLPLLEDDRYTIIRPGKWKLVCSTLAEIEAFADDLIDNKNKQARRLATTIMHEVVPPLFARELEEEKAAKKKARSRKAGIDTRNVVNTRSRRARKAVDYTYNTKELDKAIREYNQQRDSDSDEEDDGDKQQDKTSSSKRTRRTRRAAPTAAVQGTRSSTRIQQKRKRGAAE